MAKKKKSKLKKFLKKAAPLLALGLGAAALGRKRTRDASIADNEAKESGFGAMKLKDYGPHTIGGYHTPVKAPMRKSLASPKWNKMDTSEVDMNYVPPSTKRYNNPDFGMGAWDGAKKGGRAGKDFGKRGGGKAKRGLGRAFTKGRK